MRKMATVQKIAEIKAIPKADRICAYRVGGWWVVDSVGKYNVGDLVVYCEVDSWIPNSIAPFLSKGQEPRVYNGVKGERLRTVKLRGQLSQGLLLPMSVLEGEDSMDVSAYAPGDDCAEYLRIQKWEAPIPAQLAGDAVGLFPSFVRKTDQERVQNLTEEFAHWQTNASTWEVTEKLDGSSMTVFVNGDEFGVCSRNLWLKDSDTNSFWVVAKREQLIEKIRSTGRNYAFQGELCGEGIQKNPYGIRGQQFFLYDIFDIDRGEYLSPNERQVICRDLNIEHIPVIVMAASVGVFSDVAEVLTFAEGPSVFNAKTAREGLVFKCNEFRESFKAISNVFLLNGGD